MKHLACIMDGNRRWAHHNGVSFEKGYREGVAALQRVVRFCLTRRIPYLSAYVLSTENLSRSRSELSLLFELLEHIALEEFRLWAQEGVQVTFVGDRSRLPCDVVKTINGIECDNRQHCVSVKLQCQLLFSYGGQQEIFSAAKKLAGVILKTGMSLDAVTREQFEHCLWTASVPSPDLIIRTGGCRRLSNFLLYQAAYAEFCFFDCFWPDITEDHLVAAVAQFSSVERRYGV